MSLLRHVRTSSLIPSLGPRRVSVPHCVILRLVAYLLQQNTSRKVQRK